MPNRRTAESLSLLALVVWAAVGCDTTSAELQDEGGVAGESTEITDPPDATEPAGDASMATFGQTYDYANGISVTVSQPSEFQPSEFAAGADQHDEAVVFDVTVANDGEQPYDAALFTATAQSGTREAEPIFDVDNGVEGAPLTEVLPGRSVKFKVAFGVDDPADIVLQVTPGFEYDRVTFTS